MTMTVFDVVAKVKPDVTNLSEHDDELIETVARDVGNDELRDDFRQRYFVANTVERSLERLPDYPEIEEVDIKDVHEVRRQVQRDLAQETEFDRTTVLNDCHKRLFEGYQEPRDDDVRNEDQWAPLFVDLIKRVARYRHPDHE